MRQKLSPQQPQEQDRDPRSASVRVNGEETEPGKDRKKAAQALANALKTFATTLSQQTERQSSIVDVFSSAMREMSAEVQKNKSKVFTLEVRLREAENRIAQLEKIMGAWTRQGSGWVQ